MYKVQNNQKSTQPAQTTFNPLYTNGFFLLLHGMVHCVYWGVKGYSLQIFFSLKNFIVLANSADPNEMPHYVAFYLGLHCLPKYSKTCVKQPLKNRQNKALYDKW